MSELAIFVITVILVAVLYKIWQTALDARAAANRVARETCSHNVVQFLDGTVAFAALRLARDRSGRRRLLRIYTFDYTSDGFERAQGFVVLSGRQVESVGLAGAPS